MLPIGEFSKICGVSTKTLRYYEEIGLLHPDTINSENGYRYYAIGQLQTMLLIKRLKSYYFSLEEIKALLVLEEDQFTESLSAALNRKRNEVQEKVRAFEYTQKQMSEDIQKIEEGKSIMSYLDAIEVQLVELQAMNILSLRKMVSMTECEAGYGVFFGALYEKLAKEKLTLAGAPMTIYHSPEYNPEGYDIEFALPVKEAGGATSVFSGGLYVKSVLKGSYVELPAVYTKQREWVEREGYIFAGAPFEAYITNPYQVADPADIVTEVYFPVERSG